MMFAANKLSLGMLVLLLAAGAHAGCLAADPVAAERRLLQRVIPKHAGAFVLESIPAEEGQDVFEVESHDRKIVVRGSTGVAIASGVNWYLKNICHCHLSFCGDQL